MKGVEDGWGWMGVGSGSGRLIWPHLFLRSWVKVFIAILLKSKRECEVMRGGRVRSDEGREGEE